MSLVAELAASCRRFSGRAACSSDPNGAQAFPPYRTTDAETAGDDTLEARIGLLRLQVRDSHSTRRTPLSRINYGIGPHFEVISELEYAIDERELDEGALGFKWAKLENGRGFGVETLILLPVRSELDGAGIESQVDPTGAGAVASACERRGLLRSARSVHGARLARERSGGVPARSIAAGSRAVRARLQHNGHANAGWRRADSDAGARRDPHRIARRSQ